MADMISFVKSYNVISIAQAQMKKQKKKQKKKAGSAWIALSFVETYPNLINCTFPRMDLQRVATINKKKQTKNLNVKERFAK